MSTKTGKYEAGTKVQLKAHSYSNYSFTNWIKDGKPYSDSPIISCVVEPGTNHYVAHFRFNPGNPDEPNTPTTTHRLNLKSNPDGASSFNISSGNRYESGKGVNVEAYPATGWTFIDWRDEDGNQISTDRRFTYTMPDRQATLTANLKYSPGTPMNREVRRPKETYSTGRANASCRDPQPYLPYLWRMYRK